MKKTAVVVIVVSVAAVALLAILGLGSSAGETSKNTVESVLLPMAKDQLLKAVRTPSTVEFVEARANKVGDAYRVFLKYDAQNLMGATVRKVSFVEFTVVGRDSLQEASYQFKGVY